MDIQLQKADSTSVFSVHMTYVCPFILQLWHMVVLLIILMMAWWYHFWHIKFLKVSIYFILSSEIDAYLQWIKVIFSQVKWYCINSQVSDTIYVFTVVKIWKFLAQMHFKMFGKWEASWKWCYGHSRVLTTETFGLSQFLSCFSPFQFFLYIIHCFSVSKYQNWGLVFSPFPELVSILFRNNWNAWT